MKKLIHKKLNHVLIVHGAKKKEVLNDIYGEDDAWSVLIEPDKIPSELRVDNTRLSQCIRVEADIDKWMEEKHSQMTSGAIELEELRNVVHGDMINFINRIDEI